MEFFDELLASRKSGDPEFVSRLVERLLHGANDAGASDVHLHPAGTGLHVRWRIDGVLQSVGVVPQEVAENVVVRLKVLARLLTYETRTPQEGRIVQAGMPTDIRVSTFPTVFGEKVVARLLPSDERFCRRLGDLGLPTEILDSVSRALSQTAGALIIVGPAGSGKTTTAYACLREIISNEIVPRNIATVEDPVEVVIEQVAQSEVNESAGFTLKSGLKSLVRQDPDVIFVGEIRDPETATIALQAALTGQLVITTFHAPDAATAVSRLADMGIPSYVLRSAVFCIVGQQLVRRLCDCAAAAGDPTDDAPSANLGLDVDAWRNPRGCPRCQQSGYAGRRLVAELLDLQIPEILREVQPEIDSHHLRSVARANGMRTLLQRAADLVQNGETSPAEVRRVFGLVN